MPWKSRHFLDREKQKGGVQNLRQLERACLRVPFEAEDVTDPARFNVLS